MRVPTLTKINLNITKNRRRYLIFEFHVPTLLLHSTAVGKYGCQPLNHAVRKLTLRARVRRIVLVMMGNYL